MPRPRALAEYQGAAFEKHVGARSLAQLRAMPASKLLAACGDKGVPDFVPDIDCWFLPRSPDAIYEAGKQAHVPLLAGSNSGEGNYTTLLGDAAPTPANYRDAVERKFGSHAGEVLKLYPGRTEAEVKESGSALAGDEFIAFSTWRWMHMQRMTGDAPVYYYRFTKARPAKCDGSAGPDPAAVHSGEIEYALGNLSTNHVYAWTDDDRNVSATMEGYFANFIKTGDPNGPGLPHWPAMARKDGGLLRQTIGVRTHAIVDHNASRYEFLDRLMHNAHL